jgi:hypothetical protein
MTADTDAKGKGFWRRRRRKTEPSAPEPTPAEPPPAEPTPASTESKPATAEPTTAAESTPEVAESPEDAPEASSEKSTEGDESEQADEGKSEETDKSESEAADEAKSDEAAEVVAEDKAEVDDSTKSEPTDKPSEDEEPSSEEDSEENRPAVGVTYEPEESPDGFPLEYGEIIIGLPKGGEVPESERMVDPQTVAADVPEQKPKKSSKKTAAKKPAVVSEAPEEPTPEDQAPATQDEDSAKAEKEEPATEEAAPSDDKPADEVTDETPAAEPKDMTPADVAEPAEEPPTAEAKDETPAADGPEPTEEPATDEVKPAGEDTPEESEESATAEPTSDDESTDETATKDEPAAEVEKAAAAEVPDEPQAADESDEPADAESSADEASAEDSAADEPVSDDAAPVADDKADASVVEEASDETDASDDADSEGKTSDATDVVEAAEAEADSDAEAADAEASDDADAEVSDEADPDAEADSEVEAEAEVVLSAEEMAAKVAEQQAAMALITALMKLRGALADSKLPLDVVGADEARQQRKAMLDQLDDYVLPRLVQLEAPVLAVVGGSTGAGKSTLVNSLIGQVVSEPGVLRPTTRSPVLIHNPADAEWFAGDRVLPGMARSSGDSPGGTEDPGQIRLVAADTIPRGLAVLDAPDIDSVVEANRDLATQLLAAADLWLFVTTAARYADAVPWEFLQSASDRSTAVAVVLDRAPADTIDDITGHLAQMLLERGLGDSPLFSIKETVVDDRGMLPGETVASIKDWLIDLAADAEARSAVVRRTLQGAVTAMTKKTPAFSKAVRDQADTFVELRANAETAYERAVKDIAKSTQDGTMLRGEVLARWQEFVGTGELLKGLQTNVGRMRDKVRASIVGKPPPTRDLNDAVESGLESLLREHAEAAAERAEESWQSTAAGRQLLAAGDRDLGRMSKDFPTSASRAVREWQGYVLDLVRKEGADKRSTARILAYGVNGLGLSLMVVIFASTAGITGAEVGVGAGTAVVGQKLLEAVFGDQAVRSLAAKARQDLDDRVHALMDAEFARYLAVLDQHPVDPEAPRQLTEAARAVEDCT